MGVVNAEDRHFRCFCVVCGGVLEYWGKVRRYDMRFREHG